MAAAEGAAAPTAPAAVEPAAAPAAPARAPGGAIAAGSEHAGRCRCLEIRGVPAGFTSCRLASASSACGRVRSSEGGKAVVSTEPAAAAAARTERAADPATCRSSAACGDDDPVFEPDSAAADVGRPATAAPRLPRTVVVAERLASLAPAVPAAAARCRPDRVAAPAAHVHVQGLFRCHRDDGHRLHAGTGRAYRRAPTTGSSDDFDPEPADPGRHRVGFAATQ